MCSAASRASVQPPSRPLFNYRSRCHGMPPTWAWSRCKCKRMPPYTECTCLQPIEKLRHKILTVLIQAHCPPSTRARPRGQTASSKLHKQQAHAKYTTSSVKQVRCCRLPTAVNRSCGPLSCPPRRHASAWRDPAHWSEAMRRRCRPTVWRGQQVHMPGRSLARNAALLVSAQQQQQQQQQQQAIRPIDVVCTLVYKRVQVCRCA